MSPTLANELFEVVVVFIKAKYANITAWKLALGNSQGVASILLLATSGKEVSMDMQFNGTTIQKAAESGLFSIEKTTGFNVKVQIPFLTLAILNSISESTVCRKFVINPFEKDY